MFVCSGLSVELNTSHRQITTWLLNNATCTRLAEKHVPRLAAVRVGSGKSNAMRNGLSLIARRNPNAGGVLSHESLANGRVDPSPVGQRQGIEKV
ncbi:hypothetical protein V8F44DRAFT_605533 [Aspergillus fumigatus]